MPAFPCLISGIATRFKSSPIPGIWPGATDGGGTDGGGDDGGDGGSKGSAREDLLIRGKSSFRINSFKVSMRFYAFSARCSAATKAASTRVGGSKNWRAAGRRLTGSGTLYQMRELACTLSTRQKVMLKQGSHLLRLPKRHHCLCLPTTSLGGHRLAMECTEPSMAKTHVDPSLIAATF